MRKWTYLVAALLMGGVSTSLTSCIDNDEPAGITDLRGAKAEFIRAKAEYEAALTAIKLVQVDIKKQELAREEIMTQIKELELKITEAKAEKEIAEFTAQKDLLVEKYKKALIDAQAETAGAEELLIEALNKLEITKLTDRNNQFAKEIDDVRRELSTALGDLRDARLEQFNAEKDLMAFDSKNKYYKAEKQLDIAIDQHDLDIMQTLRDNYVELNKTAGDLKALAEQKSKLEAQKLALVKKEADAFQKLLEMRRSESFIAFSNTIQGFKLEQDKDTTFVLKATEVDPSIQNELYNAIKSLAIHTPGYLDDFFKPNANTGDYEMIADYESPAEVGSDKVVVKNVEDKVVDPIIDAVKAKYQDGYANEYNTMFGATLTGSDLFDEVTGKVKASYANNVKAELERLQINKADVETSFKDAVKTWINSYNAYVKALKDYGFYKENYGENKEFIDIKESIQGYDALDAADKTEKAAIALRDKIVAYAELRNAVDGGTLSASQWGLFDATYTKSASGDPLKDAATLATFHTFIAGIANNVDQLVGSATLPDNIGYVAGYDGDATMLQFYYASYELFGATSTTLNKANVIVPLLAEGGTAPTEITKAIPEDVEPYAGSKYANYLFATDFATNAPFIYNINKWTALYDTLNGQADLIAERNKGLQDAIDKVVAEWQDELVKVWTAELNVYLIRGNKTIDGEDVITTPDNPYSPYLNTTTPENGGIGYADRTEEKALDDQIALVQNALDNDGKFWIVTYDPATNKYDTEETSDLTGKIETTESDIIDKQKEIEQNQLLLDQFEKLESNGTEYRAILAQKVEDEKANVANVEKVVEVYKKNLQDLLNAYEKGSGSETPAE